MIAAATVAGATWRIDSGHYGDTKLGGLSFSVFANWPGAIHEGGGRAVSFFDVSKVNAVDFHLLGLNGISGYVADAVAASRDCHGEQRQPYPLLHGCPAPA